MKKLLTFVLTATFTFVTVMGQTPQNPQKPREEVAPDDVVRITANLVQTDVVVTDKNDQIVPNLKLEDFELFENGKRQELHFTEFVSAEGPRAEDLKTSGAVPAGVDTSLARNLTANDVKRVMAFVVDDVTIPADDMVRVREMLSDFVDHKMQIGDLVAVVRTVGGKGLLEEFTGDQRILHRAISQLGVRSVPPYLSFAGPDAGRISAPPSPLADATTSETINSNTEFEGPGEGTNQVPKAMLALSISNDVVEGLKQIPGRKNLILISGGLPLFELSRSGSVVGDIGQVFRVLTDNATRAGVVINTMDVRGLRATGVVAPFVATPGKSALGGGTFAGGDESTIGRGHDVTLLGERPLSEQLTLTALANNTGGVSVINSNNFGQGLDRVLNRNKGYYRLAYKPSEKFDSKFHKLEVKIRRSGFHVYSAGGYFAHAEAARKRESKEDEIKSAAKSPLAKRDFDLETELQYTFSPSNQALLDINIFIDIRKLNLKQAADGKYHTQFDVVGFVLDQLGKTLGGISQTIKADLTEQDYQRALASGISYTASTQAPPGYYQVRLVVREEGTGRMGTVSKYFEVPDLANKQLNVSSILLYGINSAVAGNKPEQLSATRVISRKQDLRYAVVVYNAKMDNGKSQARSRLIISQGNKVLFQEPEQPVQTPGSSPGQLLKIGQLVLAKVNPGRYVLTLVVTDPLADKKHQTVGRSIDFTVVN
jgi:VWFA-related protein